MFRVMTGPCTGKGGSSFWLGNSLSVIDEVVEHT